MYILLKKTAKKIIPQRVLLKYEFILRKIISYSYKGKLHKCNICETTLKRFVELPSNDLLCPACGSLSRTRRLWKLIHEDFMLKGNILDFSPPRCLYINLKKNQNIRYYATDFADEFAADYRYDITAIPKEDNFFDFIICYHILEHVEDDAKAMAELYRVLKPEGICLIQTPFKEGTIYEDSSKTTKEERLIAFGQEDHVRTYSIKGLKKRLENTGFTIEILYFEEKPKHYYGFINETVLKLIK